MRRLLTARPFVLGCLALGLLLAAGVAAALLTWPGGERKTAPTSTGATAPSATPPPPPSSAPPPATAPVSGPEIGDLRVVAADPLAATVSWRTGVPTKGLVAAGPPGGEPFLWWDVSEAAAEHTVRISGLAYGTTYDVSVTAVAPGGGHDRAGTTVETAGPPLAAAGAVTRQGTLLVGGQPFFPILSFGECVDGFETSLPVGTNLYVGNRCGGLEAQLDALHGHGLSLAMAGEAIPADHGVIGTYYPDEPDGHGLTARNMAAFPPREGPRFMTLTNHFYSGAAPLTVGRGIYPGLIARADVIGFDLFPLQTWCRPDRLVDVYLAQRELTHLSAPRPTFQWIEAAGMTCPHEGPTAVTPATVRAESWLAVAGGARGLGYFPPAAWTGDVGEAIGDVTTAVRYLGPALLAPEHTVRVEPADGPVRAGGRAANGALYVIAANAGTSTAEATFRVPGLDGRTLSVFGEARRVQSSGDSFRDSFAPLAAHVYVAAPASR
jgi:hypothetical protein